MTLHRAVEAREATQARGPQGAIVTVERMDNIGIVVADLEAAIGFFIEPGFELEGRAAP